MQRPLDKAKSADKKLAVLKKTIHERFDEFYANIVYLNCIKKDNENAFASEAAVKLSRLKSLFQYIKELTSLYKKVTETPSTKIEKEDLKFNEGDGENTEDASTELGELTTKAGGLLKKKSELFVKGKTHDFSTEGSIFVFYIGEELILFNGKECESDLLELLIKIGAPLKVFNFVSDTFSIVDLIKPNLVAKTLHPNKIYILPFLLTNVKNNDVFNDEIHLLCLLLVDSPLSFYTKNLIYIKDCAAEVKEETDMLRFSIDERLDYLEKLLPLEKEFTSTFLFCLQAMETVFVCEMLRHLRKSKVTDLGYLLKEAVIMKSSPVAIATLLRLGLGHKSQCPKRWRIAIEQDLRHGTDRIQTVSLLKLAGFFEDLPDLPIGDLDTVQCHCVGCYNLISKVDDKLQLPGEPYLKFCSTACFNFFKKFPKSLKNYKLPDRVKQETIVDEDNAEMPSLENSD